jgi:GntR family transcriptional regulator, arabinose operon transcriptional repressor
MSQLLERGNDAQPLYVQVASILKQRILSGIWREGEGIPPEKTLCVEFEIARGTLRQALKILEDEGYLRREQGRGTFITLPERGANGGTKTNHLAFVVPYVRDSSVSSILVGFQRVAEQSGYSVIFNHVNNDLAQQEEVVHKLVRQGVMGVALYPVDSEHISPVAELTASGYPIVLVDRYLKGLSTDYVMTDHFGGALRGVHYLLNRGHQRVGFVTWLSPAISMEHRMLGYMQALRERGIQPDNDLICHVKGYPTVDLTPLQTYLSSSQRPTAILAANDQVAIALYRAAAAVGLRVPQDLSVVGFDNLDISSHLDPPLTTVAQPFMKIGETAVELLLRRIRGEAGHLQQITLTPELVIRQSCLALERAERSAM